MGESKRRKAAGERVEGSYKSFKDRVRKHSIRDISEVEIGEGWMRGEVAAGDDMIILHAPGETPTRSTRELKIWMQYETQKMTAVLPVEAIDQMITDWRNLIKQLPKSKDERSSTRQVLMEWLLLNKHIDQPGVQNHGGAMMAAGLIWLHFTGPLEPLMRAAVERDNKVEVGYDITNLPGHKNYNWRTCFYPVGSQ